MIFWKKKTQLENSLLNLLVVNLDNSELSLAVRACPALYYMISGKMLPEQMYVKTVITEWPLQQHHCRQAVRGVAASAEPWTMNAGEALQQATGQSSSGVLKDNQVALTGLGNICESLWCLLLSNPVGVKHQQGMKKPSEPLRASSYALVYKIVNTCINSTAEFILKWQKWAILNIIKAQWKPKCSKTAGVCGKAGLMGQRVKYNDKG